MSAHQTTEKTEPKIQKSYRMCEAVINLPAHSRRRKLVIGLLESLVTSIGVTMQSVLAKLEKSLEVRFDDDKKILSARLPVSVSGTDIPRAQNLLAQEMTDFGYTNSYRIVAVLEGGEQATVVFEIAKVKYRIKPTGTSQKMIDDMIAVITGAQPALLVELDKALEACVTILAVTNISGNKTGSLKENVIAELKKRRSLNAMPANFLAQVILGWCQYSELDTLAPSIKAGVAQKAAEQVLSYLQLKDEDSNTTFPSTGERSPFAKRTAWLGALDRVSANTAGFEYKRARDIDPTIPEDDPRGERRINVNPDWVTFVSLPEVDRFPGTFAKNDVVVYRRYLDPKDREAGKAHYPTHTGRLHAFIPVKEPLDPALLWWTKHLEEFEPLPAFGARKLSKNANALMVPLEYRDNLEMLFETNREVKWTILVEEAEHRFRHGHHGGNLPFLGKRWLLKFATETEVAVRETSTVLGIHFHEEKVEKEIRLVVVWALGAGDKVLEQGEFEQTQILDYALLKKSYLEGLQRSHRWVGGKQFRRELKRRTEELAHRIVRLACEKNAMVVLEDIKYVPKQGQGLDLNSRHSLWNYADLSGKIEFFAKDRAGIPTSRKNEFVLKFTCPACQACRKQGETSENATTWRKNNVLFCRSCNTETVQDRYYFARRIALGT